MDSLTKFLAQAGVDSRRKVVNLIKQGLISVNATIIKEPGYKVKPTDVVVYGGKKVQPGKKYYILLNKPKDYITTVSDEYARKTVLDLLPSHIASMVYPVGRLDRNTTGLLMLTNDGDFAQKLAHPRFDVQKGYTVFLDKPFSPVDAHKLKEGVVLFDGIMMVDSLEYDKRWPKKVTVYIHSGKNRIVRRLFQALGYHVLELDRVFYAGLIKKGLPVGKWRHLTDREIACLC